MTIPSISTSQFAALGFVVDRITLNEEGGGIWYARYIKELNHVYLDYLEISWSCCNNRYKIYRQTQTIKNITVFEGFLRNVEDLKFLLELIDYRRFYETSKQYDS